jgi:hypothetical protein
MPEVLERRGLEHGVVIGRFPTEFGVAVATAFLYPANGALGVTLASPQGEPIGVLSVNLAGRSNTLNHGEFHLKQYGENAGLAHSALQSGLFQLLPKTVVTGYVEIPVARLVETTPLHRLYGSQSTRSWTS